jgi:hypothetical protein
MSIYRDNAAVEPDVCAPPHRPFRWAVLAAALGLGGCSVFMTAAAAAMVFDGPRWSLWGLVIGWGCAMSGGAVQAGRVALGVKS